MIQRLWRIGELAKRTGLTIRTLHHYDSIGLFSPSQLSESGHRLYTDQDIGRLQQILMLRQLGFMLNEVKTIIEDPRYDAAEMLQTHLSRLSEQISNLEDLRDRVQEICDVVQLGQPVSAEQLMVAIRLTTMIKSPHFGTGHAEQMKERFRSLRNEGIQESLASGHDLLAEFRRCYEARRQPSDPVVAALARRWRDEVEAMVPVGDEFVRSAEAYYQENPDQGLQYGMDGELYRYIKQAVEMLTGGQ